MAPLASRAQTRAAPQNWIDLAHSGNTRSDLQACAYSEFLQSYLRSLTDQEISASIEKSQASYQAEVGSDDSPLDENEQKFRQQMLKDYAALTASGNPREGLSKTFQSLCTTGRTVGGDLLKSGQMTASVATSAITLPIRFVAKFGIGVFTRKTQTKRGPTYGEFSGTSGLFEDFGDVIYQSVRAVFFTGNPLLIGVYGIGAIDMNAQEFCKSLKPKSERQLSFCGRYASLKTTEFKISNVGSAGGAATGKFLLHTLDFRSNAAADFRICDKNFKKQIRIAKRARERIMDRMVSLGITTANVLVNPPELNGCVSLKIFNLDPVGLATLKKESGFEDGIPYTLALKVDGPTIGAPDADGSTPAAPAPLSAPLSAPPASATLTEFTPTLLAALASPSPMPTAIPTPTPDFHTDENICRAAYATSEYDYVSRGASLESKSELIQVAVSPSRFAKPTLEEFITDASKMRSEPVADFDSGKNLILIMAPTDQQLKEYNESLPHLKELEADLKARYKVLRWLEKSSSHAECLSRQAQVHFDYLGFLELKKTLSSITVASRIEEYKAMNKEAEKSGKSFLNLSHPLKLTWETRDMATLNDLRNALNDPLLENLVIVTHGEENGTIVDSRLNEVPSSAFSTLMPKLQSITFFSCHSIEAEKKYFLKDAFAKNESFQQIRTINHVISSDYLESHNQAPVMGLSDFLKQLDGKLYQNKIGNTRVQLAFQSKMKEPAASEVCSIHFQGLKISRGAFNAKLNGHWAGIYEAGEENSEHPFPCSWLLPQNDLILENNSLAVKSAFNSANASASLSGKPIGTLNDAHPVPKIRPNGDIVRLHWTLQN
jgi:hypothetical protein